MRKAELNLTVDQKLYYDIVNVARQLFQALDEEALQIYKEYKKGDGHYPSEKIVFALIEGKRRGLGKGRALEIMDENIAADILTIVTYDK